MENIFKMDGEEEYRKGLEQLTSNEQYNLRKALCYFCEAAEKQHVEAMFQAGYLYLFGEPQITRNVLKATEYIKMSADAGISIAKDYMAICYLFGIVVEKKEEFAIQLLEENFNLGDTLASYILSDIYQNGCGTIDQDEKKSIISCDDIIASTRQSLAFRPPLIWKTIAIRCISPDNLRQTTLQSASLHSSI